MAKLDPERMSQRKKLIRRRKNKGREWIRCVFFSVASSSGFFFLNNWKNWILMQVLSLSVRWRLPAFCVFLFRWQRQTGSLIVGDESRLVEAWVSCEEEEEHQARRSIFPCICIQLALWIGLHWTFKLKRTNGNFSELCCSVIGWDATKPTGY